MGFIRIRPQYVIVLLFPGTSIRVTSLIGLFLLRSLAQGYVAALFVLESLSHRVRTRLGFYKSSFFVNLETFFQGTRIFLPGLSLYYRAATLSLRLAGLKRWACRFNVYSRHHDFAYGSSDIDLIVVYDDGAIQEGAGRFRFFSAFFRLHRKLRFFFPMLCSSIEVRFIPYSRARSALRDHGEHDLLYSTKTWRGEVQQIAGLSAEIAAVANSPRFFPMTRFFGVALQGPLQTMLFRSRLDRQLSPGKFRKSVLKSIQHFHFHQTGECVPTRVIAGWSEHPSLSDDLRKLIRSSWVSTKAEANEELLRLVRYFNGVYGAKLGGVAGQFIERPELPEWVTPRLEAYLWNCRRKFGTDLKFLVLRSPFSFPDNYRVLALVGPQTRPSAFCEWLNWSHEDYLALGREGIRLQVSSPKLLSSELFHLWGESPLEAEYLLGAGELYTPDGGIEISLPPVSWTEWKLKDSLFDLEESQLPYSVFESRKPLETTKLYRVLLHYFAFLDKPGQYGSELGRLGAADFLKQTAEGFHRILPLPSSKTGAAKTRYLAKMISTLNSLAVAPGER